MNLSELIKDSHELAVEKGWWSLPNDTVESKLLMIHCEISEAAECYRNGEMTIYYDAPPLENTPVEYGMLRAKPLGFPIEVADIAIRCADLLGHFLEAPAYQSAHDFRLYDEALPRGTSVVNLLLEMHECLDYSEGSIIDTIELCRSVALKVGFDLDEAIRIKQQYNRTRPHRHGDKLI